MTNTFFLSIQPLQYIFIDDHISFPPLARQIGTDMITFFNQPGFPVTSSQVLVSY
jgi:hypothetical protein